MTLKIYGPNADVGSTPINTHVAALASGTGAKTVEWVIQIPPFALEATITNDAGVALAASANDIYSQTFSEESA